MALPTSESTSGSSDSQASPASDADIAQAFRDLARGEQTAQALESHLTSLERKLDDFLAQFEEPDNGKGEKAVDGSKSNVGSGSEASK